MGVGVDGNDEVMGLPLPLDEHSRAKVLLAFVCGWQKLIKKKKARVNKSSFLAAGKAVLNAW